MKKYCNYDCDKCHPLRHHRCHLENRIQYDRSILCCGISDYNDMFSDDVVYIYSKAFIEKHIFEVLEKGC